MTVSGPVRYLAVMLPLAFIAQTASVLADMPMPSMMPGVSLPGVGDISDRILQGVITSVFESLGGD